MHAPEIDVTIRESAPMATDPGTTMVEEFHRAYGFVVSPEPNIPNLTAGEAGLIRLHVTGLEKLAGLLKTQASHANGLGQRNLGLVLIRMQLQVEETAEVFDAILRRDLPHLLQEVSDLQYVTNGLYLTLGLQGVKPAADVELHRANMSKLNSDGTPIVDSSGRSVKGPHFRPPDMARVLLERAGGA